MGKKSNLRTQGVQPVGMAMANEAVQIKIPADIEYKVLGNAFGLMIACGGLLAGNMMSERSLEYWREDIVVIVLVVFLAFRLLRTFVTTMTVYAGAPPRPASPVSKENIQRMHAKVAQLPETMGYTPDQVIEEVARRIEVQKAEAAKRALSQN